MLHQTHRQKLKSDWVERWNFSSNFSDTKVNSCLQKHTVNRGCQYITYPSLCANVDQVCDEMCPNV